MIFSEDRSFIYARIPKTASTSVSAALEPYHRSARDRNPLARLLRKLAPNSTSPALVNFRARSHWGLQAAHDVLGPEVFDRCYKFTVVRHPYSWIGSLYQHVMRHRDDAQFAAVYAPIYAADPGLNAFVAMLPDFRLPPQSALLLGYDGAMLADATVRVERLAEEIAPVFARLGIEPEIPLLNRGGYSEGEKLSAASQALLQELFALDFALFGYAGDGGLADPQPAPAGDAEKWGKVLRQVGARDFSPWEPATLP